MGHAHRSVPDISDCPRPDRWQRLFRGQESELRQLRHWLTGLLPDSPGRDDLISVAVELGTNAVQHTASGVGGWFTVEIASLPPVIRVSVTDEGAADGPRLTTGEAEGDASEDPALASAFDLDLDLDFNDDLDPDFDHHFDGACASGRGLIIVRALAVTCGVCGNASGRTVWAEVAQTPIKAQAQDKAQIPTLPKAPPQTQAQPQPQTQAQLRAQAAAAHLDQGRSSRPSASSAMAISRTR